MYPWSSCAVIVTIFYRAPLRCQRRLGGRCTAWCSLATSRCFPQPLAATTPAQQTGAVRCLLPTQRHWKPFPTPACPHPRCDLTTMLCRYFALVFNHFCNTTTTTTTAARAPRHAHTGAAPPPRALPLCTRRRCACHVGTCFCFLFRTPLSYYTRTPCVGC